MYVWLCVLDECLVRMHLALITCNSGSTLQRPHVHLIRLRLRLQHGDMATCNVPPATGWLYLDIDAKPACCLAYHQVPPSLRQAKSCIMSHLSHPVVELAVRKLTTKRKRESDDGYVGMGMLGIAPIRAPLTIAVLSIWCNYIAVCYELIAVEQELWCALDICDTLGLRCHVIKYAAPFIKLNISLF